MVSDRDKLLMSEVEFKEFSLKRKKKVKAKIRFTKKVISRRKKALRKLGVTGRKFGRGLVQIIRKRRR